jgi:hypothetical protein
LDFNMDGSTGVVGTVRSGEPASIADEVMYVNWLLGLGANATDTHDFGGAVGSHDFQTSLVDYNGSVSAVGAMKDETGGTSGSGWTYVLAKYDGPNGGDVVWFVGGAAFTLPSDSSGLWTNNQDKGYGLSHWTGFGSTSVPDTGMSAMLLALGLTAVAIAAFRRRVI